MSDLNIVPNASAIIAVQKAEAMIAKKHKVASALIQMKIAKQQDANLPRKPNT